MGQPVVHVEVIGCDPQALHRFYHELFGWDFQVADASSELISAKGQYGFVDGSANDAVTPVNGGVGGGPGFQPSVIFSVAVADVDASLATAERLGGRRLLGPEPKGSDFTVGHFSDPEGNVVGVAGPAAS